jgi:UDP-glucose 4-epimerase
MKRLLITGARGFIGRHCIDLALHAGYEVFATTSGQGVDLDPRINWHQVDLLSPRAAQKLIDDVRPSHILHLAWVTEHGSFWTSPDNLAWLRVGIELVSAFADHGGERFVSVGTCAEYDWSSDAPLVENVTPDLPQTFYGQIKLTHHDVLMACAKRFGFSAATGRIFLLYGPHEGANRLVPIACRKLISGERADFSSGQQLRDFLHVSDVAGGLITLLNSDIEGICNVSAGEGTRIGQVVTHVGELLGRSDLINLGALPDRPNEPTTIVGDSQLLRSTGWTPLISLADGLRTCVDFWKTQNRG